MKTMIKAQLNPTETASVAVLARAVALTFGGVASGGLVYMPEGENLIEASVNGQPEQVLVIVDETTADRLQADLTARIGTGVLPALDYNHLGGRASGWPSAFRWEPGVGVICDVIWTPQAVESIRAGEWRYFSPEFRYDRKTKTVLGLRATGPLGGLVNDPAFRAMPVVKARHADDASKTNHNNLPDSVPESPQTQYHNMKNETIVAALHAAGIISQTEAAGDNAPALVAARIAEIKSSAVAEIKAAHATEVAELGVEIAALKATIHQGKEKEAKDAVAAAVKAGRIAPKDEATQKWWEGNIIRDGEASIKALNAVPAVAALTPTAANSQEEAPVKPEDATTLTAAQFSALTERQKMDFSVKGGRIAKEA